MNFENKLAVYINRNIINLPIPDFIEVAVLEEILETVTPKIDNIAISIGIPEWKRMALSVTEGVSDAERELFKSMVIAQADRLIDLPERYEWIDDRIISAIVDIIVLALNKGEKID